MSINDRPTLKLVYSDSATNYPTEENYIFCKFFDQWFCEKEFVDMMISFFQEDHFTIAKAINKAKRERQIQREVRRDLL